MHWDKIFDQSYLSEGKKIMTSNLQVRIKGIKINVHKQILDDFQNNAIIVEIIVVLSVTLYLRVRIRYLPSSLRCIRSLSKTQSMLSTGTTTAISDESKANYLTSIFTQSLRL